MNQCLRAPPFAFVQSVGTPETFLAYIQRDINCRWSEWVAHGTCPAYMDPASEIALLIDTDQHCLHMPICSML